MKNCSLTNFSRCCNIFLCFVINDDHWRNFVCFQPVRIVFTCVQRHFCVIRNSKLNQNEVFRDSTKLMWILISFWTFHETSNSSFWEKHWIFYHLINELQSRKQFLEDVWSFYFSSSHFWWRNVNRDKLHVSWIFMHKSLSFVSYLLKNVVGKDMTTFIYQTEHDFSVKTIQWTFYQRAILYRNHFNFLVSQFVNWKRENFELRIRYLTKKRLLIFSKEEFHFNVSFVLKSDEIFDCLHQIRLSKSKLEINICFQYEPSLPKPKQPLECFLVVLPNKWTNLNEILKRFTTNFTFQQRSTEKESLFRFAFGDHSLRETWSQQSSCPFCRSVFSSVFGHLKVSSALCFCCWSLTNIERNRLRTSFLSEKTTFSSTISNKITEHPRLSSDQKQTKQSVDRRDREIIFHVKNRQKAKRDKLIFSSSPSFQLFTFETIGSVRTN